MNATDINTRRRRARRVRSEDVAPYVAGTAAQSDIDRAAEDALIQSALDILARRLTAGGKGKELSNPQDTRAYLQLELAAELAEVFACLFLDNRHRVISFDRMFHGTIDSASVHPREVVRRALQHNAAAVILAHNHPSGVAEPSNSDRALTRRLTEALELIDVRVLDHIVIGDTDSVSFAERGLL